MHNLPRRRLGRGAARRSHGARARLRSTPGFQCTKLDRLWVFSRFPIRQRGRSNVSWPPGWCSWPWQRSSSSSSDHLVMAYGFVARVATGPKLSPARAARHQGDRAAAADRAAPVAARRSGRGSVRRRVTLTAAFLRLRARPPHCRDALIGRAFLVPRRSRRLVALCTAPSSPWLMRRGVMPRGRSGRALQSTSGSTGAGTDAP